MIGEILPLVVILKIHSNNRSILNVPDATEAFLGGSSSDIVRDSDAKTKTENHSNLTNEECDDSSKTLHISSES